MRASFKLENDTLVVAVVDKGVKSYKATLNLQHALVDALGEFRINNFASWIDGHGTTSILDMRRGLSTDDDVAIAKNVANEYDCL